MAGVVIRLRVDINDANLNELAEELGIELPEDYDMGWDQDALEDWLWTGINEQLLGQSTWQYEHGLDGKLMELIRERLND